MHGFCLVTSARHYRPYFSKVLDLVEVAPADAGALADLADVREFFGEQVLNLRER